MAAASQRRRRVAGATASTTATTTATMQRHGANPASHCCSLITIASRAAASAVAAAAAAAGQDQLEQGQGLAGPMFWLSFEVWLCTGLLASLRQRTKSARFKRAAHAFSLYRSHCNQHCLLLFHMEMHCLRALLSLLCITDYCCYCNQHCLLL